MFAVHVLGSRGDTVLTRSYHYDPVPLTSELADSISDALVRSLDHDDEYAMLRAALDELDYLPAFLPPVTSLVTGRDGTIWLRREDARDPVIWDVLDSGGTLRKRVEIPAAVRVHEVDEHTVWGVLKDELDVSYIVRYRIVER